MKRILLLFLLLPAWPLRLAVQSPPELSQQVNDIWDLYELKQDYSGASLAATNLLASLDSIRQPRAYSDLLTVQAHCLWKTGRAHEAIPLHRAALSLRIKLGLQPVANSSQSIGLCLLEMGDYPQAMPWFLKSAALNEKTGNAVQFNWNCLDLSTCYLETGRKQQAAVWLEKLKTGTESDTIFQVLQTVKKAALILKEHPEKALQRLQNPPFNLASVSAEARAIYAQTIAAAYRELGDFKQAVQWAESARTENPQDARNLQLLAGCYRELSDDVAAARYLQQIIHLPTANILARVDARHDLALLLRYQGNPGAVQAAIDTLQQALFMLDINNPVHQISRANLLLNLGSCQMALGEYEQAIRQFETAYEQYAGHPDDRQVNQAKALIKIGRCRVQQQQFEQAEKAFDQAAALAGNLNFDVRYALHYHRGMKALAQTDWQQALLYFESALQLSQPFYPYETAESYEAITRVLDQKARISNDPTDWDTALSAAEKCMRQLDYLRNQYRDEGSESNLQQLFSRPYETAVAACLAKQQPMQALQYAENQKLVYWTHINRNAFLQAAETTGKQWPAKLTSVQSRLEYLQRAARKQPDAALFDSIEQLTRQKTALLDSLRSFSSHAGLRNVESLTAALPKQRQVLYYYWGEQQITLFYLKHDTLQTRAIPNDPDFSRQLQHFINLCQTPMVPPAAEKAHQTDLAQTGVAIYRRLFPDLIELEPGKPLTIVPDGLLCLLPFEALPSDMPSAVEDYSSYNWLLRQYPINIAYTLSEISTPAATTAKHRGALAVAPQFFDGDKLLDTLPNNEREAWMVCRLAGGACLINQAADKQSFLEQAPLYQLLHLSTHGIVRDDLPEDSYLSFGNRASEGRDTRLYLSEIYGLSLPAELAVLSACHSANGIPRRGEGVMSLSRAFRYAGARSVLASLWLVKDNDAADIMERFYTALANGQAKSAALREAKTVLMNSHHPFFWAGYVLSGQDDAINMGMVPGSWFWFFVLAALLMLVGYLVKRMRQRQLK